MEDNSTAGPCMPCSSCGPGQGAARPCGPLENTVCQPCGPGTYSEERSSSKPCQPCSKCQENEVEIRACQPNSNTLCMGKDGRAWLMLFGEVPEDSGLCGNSDSGG